MKLSLPLALRSALMASVALVGTTLTSSVMAGGLITLALAPQAAAAETITLTEDTIYENGLTTSGTLQADGYTVTLMADSDIATTTSGTSLSVTGGHTDLRGGALNNLNIGADGSITIHKYMEAAALTKEEGGTLNVVEAFKAGNDLYVGNYSRSSSLTIDTLVNTGTLTMGSSSSSGSLTINNGTEQGGIVKAYSVTVGGDSTFSGLTANYLYSNGNTVTLTGDSTISYGIRANEGAAQGTSLVIAGGSTSLGKSGYSYTSTLNKLHIGAEGSFTINEQHYLTANSLTQEEGSTLNINGALNVAGTLYVGNYAHSSSLTIDTLVNNGTLSMSGYNLTINNGTEQGGIVKASKLTVGGDSTFSGLTANYLYTNGNTVTLTGDSTISYEIRANEGAAQGTSLVIAGGSTTLGPKSSSYTSTLNKLHIGAEGSFTINENHYVTANSLTQEEGSTLTINGALNDAGTLHVGTYRSYNDLTVDTLVNNGTLTMGGYDLGSSWQSSNKALTILNGTTQGGVVKNTYTLTLSGDSTFDALDNVYYLKTNGNTVTLLGDSSISCTISTVDGAAQATSLTIAGGHTSAFGGTLNNISIEDGASLTITSSNTTAETLSIAETGGLTINTNVCLTLADKTNADIANITINGALNDAGTLHVGTYRSYNDLTVDTLVNNGTLTMGGYDLGSSWQSSNKALTILNGTTQGGVVKNTYTLTLSGDSTFDALNNVYYLKTNGNTVTLLGDSSINNVSMVEGTEQATTLIFAGGSSTLGSGTVNNLSLNNSSSLTQNSGTLTVGGTVTVGSGSTLTIDSYVKTSSPVTVEEGGSLVVNSGLLEGNTLTIGKKGLSLSSETTIDTLISRDGGTLNMSGYSLTISNGTEQGGIVKAKSVTVGGDSTFSALTANYLYSNGNTVTLTGNSTIYRISATETATEATSLVITGGLTTLGYSSSYGAYDSTLQNITLSDGGSLTKTAHGDLTVNGTITVGNGSTLTVDGFIKSASPVTVEEGGTLIINGSLLDGGTLRVGNDMISEDLTVEKLVNNGRLEMYYYHIAGDRAYDLTINQGTEQGGTVKAGILTLGGDGVFTALEVGSLVTHGNTVTLSEDSYIYKVSTASGAAQTTSLVIAGGNTSMGSSSDANTLNKLSIEDGAALTIKGSTTTNTLDIAEGGSLTISEGIYLQVNTQTNADISKIAINGALNDHGTLYVGNYSRSSDLTIDTLINNGTLNMAPYRSYNLTINNGTEQGGIVKANSVTVGGDSTFSALTANYLYSMGNTVKLTGDSSIYSVATAEGATQATSLVIAGGHTKLNPYSYSGYTSTINNISVSEQGRLSYGGALNVAGNIASCEAVGTLAEGLTSGIEASGNITVGTSTDGVLSENTGDVNLAGSLTSTGGAISIGDSATVGGNVAAKNNITIGGAAEVSGNMSSSSGSITLSKGGSVGGLVSATSVSVGGDASFGQLSTAGTLSANGHTVTLAGDSSMNIIDTAGTERGEGSSSLIVTGGTTAVTVDDQWVNLKSLALSDEARVTFGASLSVADDISTHGTATGTLAEGTKAGLAAKYCIYAGGSIDLAGDLTAGAYVEAKGDISVGGITSVGETTTDDLYLKSINGGVTLTGGGTVVGTVTAKSLSVGADSRLGGLSIYGSGSYDGKLHANGHTVTLTGDATVHAIDDGSNTAAAGSSTLLISGGTTTVRDNNTWTNLKNLALSSEGRMTLAASISVADNITTTTATGTLADGTNAGLESGWCILVGTEEKDGQVKKNTGDVTLAGDLVATNGYLHAMGNVNVSKVDGELGNVRSGDWLTIGGTATVAGDVTAKNDIKIVGVANITGNLTSEAGNITLSAGGTVGGEVSATKGTVTLGGSASNMSITANSAAVASASGAEVVLDAVDFALVTGNATLGNVRLTGDSSIRSTGESQGTISFERLTLVLGEHNSALTPQLATLSLEDEGVVDGLANAATFGIQSDLLKNVNLAEGGDLCIDLSYWADEINRSGLEDVTLTFAEDVNLSNHSALQVTLDGKNYTTATMVDGNVATIAVPEPTTTTLSLLALTVLAARRRRK